MKRPRIPLPRLASLAAVLCASPALAQPVLPNMWSPDDIVYATAVSGNTLYLGGVFRFLGRNTGGGAALDDGLGELIQASPRVNGIVRAIVPDGAGGWYLGGEFEAVGGSARQNLAHLDAGLNVTAWDPGADQAVRALALSGTTLYVGGAFTTCGGAARNRIAALDATTGTATSWDPSADGTVRTIVLEGTTAYVGGEFSSIGGATRYGVVSLSTATGLATAWNRSWNAGSIVLSIAPKGSTVFLGGAFANMGGKPRRSLAEIRVSNSAATNWNPDPAFEVRAMLLSGSTLYVGGTFANIGGQARSRLAALSTSDGLATSWDPSVPGGSITSVDAMVLAGATLYVGGNFHTVGSQSRRCLAGIDLATGNPTGWRPNAGPANDALLTASAIAASGTTIFVGGNFDITGLASRDFLAAIDLSTGAPTSWRPQPGSVVRCLTVNGPTVFAGGDFAQVGGQPHEGVVAIDATTGVPDAWNAAANSMVTAIAVDNGTIYAGGNFTQIGGQTRYGLAALDAATGLATGWDPQAGGGGFDAIVVSGNTVYLGGTIGAFAGQPRHGLAALDRATAGLLPWNPDVHWSIAGEISTVHDIAVGPDGLVYVGGWFDRVGAASRDRIAAIDPDTGLPAAWNPGVIGEVAALKWLGPNLYVAGGFSSIAGVPRTCVAAVDPQGAVLPWNPSIGGGQVVALSMAGANVCIGGNFTQVDAVPSLFAAVLGNPLVLDAPPAGPPRGALDLLSVAPQPLSKTATVRFTLSRSGRASIDLFDIAGGLVRRVVPSQHLEGGPHEIRFEPGGLRPGLYVLKLTTPAGAVSRKLVVAR